MSFRKIATEFFHSLVPQPKVLFTLLEDQARIAAECSPILREVAGSSVIDPLWAKTIRELEERGDTATRLVHEELNRAFIVLIDHEDGLKLTTAVDDVTDLIEEAIIMTVDFNVMLDAELKNFFLLVASAVKKLEEGVRAIRSFADISVVRNEMTDLEHAGDALYRRIFGSVYKLNVNELVGKCDAEVLTVGDLAHVLEAEVALRKKADVALKLEDALDKCKHVFDIIGNINLKHT